MPEPQIPPATAKTRLAQALSRQDNLSHEEAEALIPALIDAEFAGEAVDQQPNFVPLLRHLDQCEQCLKLYEQLADDLSAIIGEAETLPAARAARPIQFSTPTRLGDHLLLQVAQGLVRGFSVLFEVPRLVPTLATLSGNQRSLYSDRLGEVAGAPLLAVAVGLEGNDMWLQVALRDVGQHTVWRLQLEIGDQTLTALTDSRGIARFTLPPDVALSSARLFCEELLEGEE